MSNKREIFITEYKRIAIESTYKFLMTRLTTQYDEALHHIHQKPEIKQYALAVVTNLATSIKPVSYFDYKANISLMPIFLNIIYIVARHSHLLVTMQHILAQ